MPTRDMNKGGVADEIYSEDQRLFVEKNVVFKDVFKGENQEKGFVKNSCVISNVSCSDESSSIGKNSDLSENSMEKKSGDDDEEVQSSYKGPLNAMNALEEVLPIRRGISKFYNGKSKSFASLSSASSSIKDIAKPENAFIRKRRNLLACNLTWDKNRSSSLRGCNNGGGISKRVTTGSSKTALALAVAMKNSENEKDRARELAVSSSSFSPWRSFSLADLQQCVSVANTCSNLSRLANKPS